MKSNSRGPLRCTPSSMGARGLAPRCALTVGTPRRSAVHIHCRTKPPQLHAETPILEARGRRLDGDQRVGLQKQERLTRRLVEPRVTRRPCNHCSRFGWYLRGADSHRLVLAGGRHVAVTGACDRFARGLGKRVGVHLFRRFAASTKHNWHRPTPPSPRQRARRRIASVCVMFTALHPRSQ